MDEKVQIEKSILCELLMFKYKSLSIDEKLIWLNENGALLCGLKMYECIEKIHNVDEKSMFNPMIKAFWGDINDVLYRDFTVLEIKEIIGELCYEEHVEFDFNLQHRVDDIKCSTKRFNVNSFCTYYSAPLFRSIIDIYKLSEVDVFRFTKAKTYNGSTVIVFKVVKEDLSLTFAHYDISTDPGFMNLMI